MRKEPTITELIEELQKRPPVDDAARVLHDTVIRLTKGIVNAWDEYLKKTRS